MWSKRKKVLANILYCTGLKNLIPVVLYAPVTPETDLSTFRAALLPETELTFVTKEQYTRHNDYF